MIKIEISEQPKVEYYYIKIEKSTIHASNVKLKLSWAKKITCFGNDIQLRKMEDHALYMLSLIQAETYSRNTVGCQSFVFLVFKKSYYSSFNMTYLCHYWKKL